MRRLHRRRGSWVVPGGVLALMAVVFTVSSVVIGPALTDSGRESRAPASQLDSLLKTRWPHCTTQPIRLNRDQPRS